MCAHSSILIWEHPIFVNTFMLFRSEYLHTLPMELLQSDAFMEACEGTHTLMIVEHRKRIGCTYIKYNLCMPKSTLKGKKPEPFWVFFLFFYFFGRLFVCYFCFLRLSVFIGLSSLVQKAHKHTCSKSRIKLDECASHDNS